MVQYTRRTRSASFDLDPGETRVYRLPPMTREMLVMDATVLVPLPPGPPRTRRAASAAPLGGLGGLAGGGGLAIDPGNGGGAGGLTKATDITVELLLGEGVLATDANHIFHQIPGSSEQYFVRVTRREEGSSAQRYALQVNYPTVLPILDRRIPLEFFRQGFDRNWNDHPYVKSFRVHGDRATVHFDADFAAIYGLENPLVIAWSLPILDFNDVNSRSIRFSAGADKNPFEFQTGEAPFFSCTIECESEGPPELDLTAMRDVDLGRILFEFRFYIVVIGTQLEYVAKVISPTLDSIRDRIPRVDVRAIVRSKLESELTDLQRSPTGSRFGRFLTPWLLGERREIHRLVYDRATDDVVVTYVGPRPPPVDGLVMVDSTRELTVLPPALEGAPDLFDVPEERPQRVPTGMGVEPGRRVVTSAGDMPAKFDHVVVLMMENRSFDQVLGYLKRDLGRAVDGLAPEGSPEASAQLNEFGGRIYRPRHITDTKWISMATSGPDHAHEAVVAQMSDGMRHFVSNYAKRVGDDPVKLQRIMDYYGAAELPAYAELANEFAICDRWFCSHIGPTWPNRFVAFTGQLNRDGHGEPELDNPHLDEMTPIEAPTLFDHLTARGVSWRCYEHGYSFLRLYTRYTFDLESIVDFDDPTRGFLATAARGELPAVTWIEPDYIDLPPGNDDHPPADMADGQRLVAKIVRALVESPQWERTMLVITYDEHGGFYDHVTPPEAAPLLPPSGYRQLGPRVPTFVVSPYVSPQTVSSVVYEHASIAATILRRFCSPSPPRMSPRADATNDLREVFDRATPRPRADYQPMLARLGARPGRVVRDHRTERRSTARLVVPEGRDDFHAALAFARMATGSAGRRR